MYTRKWVEGTRLRTWLDREPHEPSPDLCKAIRELYPIAAREDAEAILHDDPHTEGMKAWEGRGLGRVAYSAQSLWALQRDFVKVERIRPSQLSTELEGLAISMREVVGRLRTISWETREFVFDKVDGDPNEPKSLRRIELWEQAEGDDAFGLLCAEDGSGRTALTLKLETLATLLDDLRLEAKDYSINHPGLKRVFQDPPVDLDLFEACARLLLRRGRNLAHLRTIASMVFRSITGEYPTATWGERQEKEARRLSDTPKA
jgi:hypothetical protein